MGYATLPSWMFYEHNSLTKARYSSALVASFADKKLYANQ